MAERPLPCGEVTFVLTDIEGSTALLKRLGPRYDELITTHNLVVRDALTAAGGIEVRFTGDGFLFAFDQPVAAIAGALAVQLALRDQEVRVRIGVHAGVAKIVDGEYVSVALHQAVRICAAAHGGQILVTQVVRDRAADAMPEMTGFVSVGSFHVRDFDEFVELFEVRHPDLVASFPPPRVPLAAVHNLSPQRTTFVGRAFERGEIGKLLEIASVVTLVGAGGVGKTRLASEVGLDVAGGFDAGVWFVPLQSESDPHFLIEAIARALGLSDDPARSAFDLVAARLEGSRSLLLLDNCEHVVDGVAEVVDQLLDRCPSMNVLATSREPLGLSSEHVYRIDPLPLPDRVLGDEDFERCASVALLLERARQARRDLDTTDRPAIGAICHRLEGIPLALELAGARAATSTLTEIADQLDRYGELDIARRGGAERQRTLRATIAWSYDLLAPAERRLFSRLAVFRGGFTEEAAGAMSDDAVDGPLRELLLRSLIEPRNDLDPVRYRFLEPIRRFADELADPDERLEIEDRYIRWADDFCAQAEAGTTGVDQLYWLDRSEQEHDNIRGAIETASRLGRLDAASRMVVGTQFFWLIRGYWREGVERMTQLLTSDLDREQLAAVRYARSNIIGLLGDPEQARLDAVEAAAFYRERGDAHRETAALVSEAAAIRMSGRYQDALGVYDRAIARAREEGLRDHLALCLADEGVILMQTDIVASRERLEEAAALYTELGNVSASAICNVSLGYVALTAGTLQEARERYEAALELGSQVGHVIAVSAAERGLGTVCYREGDYPAAVAHLRSAYDRFIEIGDHQQAVFTGGDLGNVRAAMGDHAGGLESLKATLAAAPATNLPNAIAYTVLRIGLLLCDTAEVRVGVRLVGAIEASASRMSQADNFLPVAASKERAHAVLGDEEFEREMAAGARLSLDEAMELAAGTTL